MSAICHETYVLDAYAVLCYLKDEPGAEKVSMILKKAAKKRARVFMTWMNLGEVYYRVCREHGEFEAARVLEVIKSWPMKVLQGDERLTIGAARVKASCPLSYADSYAIAAALRYDADLVTGDPEIRDAAAAIDVSLVWLRSDDAQ